MTQSSQLSATHSSMSFGRMGIDFTTPYFLARTADSMLLLPLPPMLFSNKCPLGLLTLFFSRHAQEKVRQAYLSLQTEKTRFLEVDNTRLISLSN